MWTHWHSTCDPGVRGRHKTVMRFLVAGYWQMPHFKPLRGKEYKGLGEIRIGSGVEWRIIGHRDAALDTFFVLTICNHKGRVYKPVDALGQAALRLKEVNDGLKGILLSVHPG